MRKKSGYHADKEKRVVQRIHLKNRQCLRAAIEGLVKLKENHGRQCNGPGSRQWDAGCKLQIENNQRADPHDCSHDNGSLDHQGR